MTVQLNISYEELAQLIDQLPEQERQALIRRLEARPQEYTLAEKIERLKSVQFPVKVNQEPSIRREDWYGEDGR